jgi:hypothetical protein
MWMKSKKNIANKKITIKITRTKLERLKNHRRWSWKSFAIWLIIYRLKNSKGEIEKKIVES